MFRKIALSVILASLLTVSAAQANVFSQGCSWGFDWCCEIYWHGLEDGWW